MTDRPGVLPMSLDTMVPLPGRTGGLAYPAQQQLGVVVDFGEIIEGPGVTFVDGGAAAVGTDDHEAAVEDMSPGIDWFEAVHLLPREPVDFGQILAQKDERFQLHNAFRETTIDLTLIVNNALPGISIPDISAPDTLPPHMSFLDPTSTPLTPVKPIVRALRDGLPKFNTTVDFTFSPGGVLKLGVTGSRVVLLTFGRYEQPFSLTFGFLTDIMEASDGIEQRVSLRKNPRERLRVRYLLSGADRRRFQAMLFDWQDNTFGVPAWEDALILTAAESAGATVFDVASTADVDLRAGSNALVLRAIDFTINDVLTEIVIGGTTVTSTTASVNTYSVGDILVPLRTMRIARFVQGGRFPVTLEHFDIDFEMTDNDTGALVGSTAAFSAYNSKVLLDDANLIQGILPESFVRRITIIDNATGIVSQLSGWDRHKRVHQKGFLARTRAEILNLKKLLVALRGPQISLYIPTFIEDVLPVDDLTSGQSTIDIEHMGYTQFIADREPKATFRVTFTDGTQLVRIVQSSSEISSTVERLVLDTTWPSTKTPAQVSRIEFYELSRFDSDNLTLRYDTVGRARLFAPMKVVFN